MTRLGAVFWGGLVLASGFATFNVKYAVQGIDDDLARVRRQMLAEQQEVRVLTAEWAYLNQPERLAELNRDFLKLAPVTTKQLQGRVDEIAMRAPPLKAPETMIAVNALPASTIAVPPLAAAPAGPAHSADAGGAASGVAETAAGADSGTTRPSDPASNRASALAEAMNLLGIAGGEHDAGGQKSRNWLATAAPIAEAQAAETRVAAEAAPAADPTTDRVAALAEALHLLGHDADRHDANEHETAGQTPRVRLAKASPVSLDALISRIVNIR